MRKSNPKLKEAIELFGKELVDIAGELVKNEPKVNTGRLKDSFKEQVLETAMGTSYTLLMWAEDYFIYVDDGRKPNSTPPPVLGEEGKPLRDWVKAKGMPESAVWAISKAIGKNGIPATNISERMMKKIFSNIAWRKFEERATNAMDDIIVQNLKGLSKKGNLTFK